ncbi:hypothetical protein HY338_00890 [Candidatus Gottesmanbacteria bacterium]|nr:hypothetical protein [Candidatus Gottesmanbacteria bacterium]
MSINNQFEKDYREIIINLKKLRSIRASDELVGRFTKVLLPQLRVVPVRPFWPILSYRLAIAIFLLTLMTGTGVVFAAERSHPGEFLYPVKKAVVIMRINLTKNPAKKIQLRLDNADQKIEELENAFDKGHTEDVQKITTSYEQEVKKATSDIKHIEVNKEDVMKKTDQSLENQTQKLEDLQKTVPTIFVPAIKKAIETSKTREDEDKEVPFQSEDKKQDPPSLNSR